MAGHIPQADIMTQVVILELKARLSEQEKQLREEQKEIDRLEKLSNSRYSGTQMIVFTSAAMAIGAGLTLGADTRGDFGRSGCRADVSGRHHIAEGAARLRRVREEGKLSAPAPHLVELPTIPAFAALLRPFTNHHPLFTNLKLLLIVSYTPPPMINRKS